MQVGSPDWEDPLEQEMEAHSSILAWKIPWTEECSGYSPWGHKESDTTEHTHMERDTVSSIHFSFRLGGHNSVYIKWEQRGFPGSTSGKEPTCPCRRCKRHGFDPLVGKIPWRRAWQPTPVFLPGESHGQRSLVGYSPQGHKE